MNWTPETWTAIATVAIAIFTCVLLVIGGLQSCLTRKAINLAREEFIASHYPRIVLREVDVIQSRIHYALTNGGSEAILVASWIMTEALAVGATPRNLRPSGHNDLGAIKFAHGERKYLDIGEGSAGYYMRFPDAKRSVTPEQPSIEDIYFVGALCYEDALGNRRNSYFRRRWNPELGCFDRTGNPDHEYAD